MNASQMAVLGRGRRRRCWLALLASAALTSGCGTARGPLSTDIADGIDATAGVVRMDGEPRVAGVPLRDAEVVVDGRRAARDSLAPGQLVTLIGHSPARVFVHAPRVGRVDSIDVAAGELVVSGQRVRLSLGPVLGGVDREEFNVGDRVAVSGFVDSQGALLATRIEPALTRADAVVDPGMAHIGALGDPLAGRTVELVGPATRVTSDGRLLLLGVAVQVPAEVLDADAVATLGRANRFVRLTCVLIDARQCQATGLALVANR